MGKTTLISEPLFLLVKCVNGDFTKVSPFLIERCIRKYAGIVKNIRKTNSGLLVETMSSEQSRKLQSMKEMEGIRVEVSPHPSLNSCRGVISCRDLMNCTTEEICDGMRDQGVTNVRRISVFKDGVRQDTPTCILTFNSPRLPEKIRAGFYSLPVRMYVPQPVRCYRCQRYGHTSMRCDNPQICVCGRSLHDGEMCQRPAKCPNCNGDHFANSKSCPTYQEEKEIQYIKAQERIPYGEARQKLRMKLPKKSFASVASSNVYKPKEIIDVKELAAELVPEITKLLMKHQESSDNYSATHKQQRSANCTISEECKRIQPKLHSKLRMTNEASKKGNIMINVVPEIPIESTPTFIRDERLPFNRNSAERVKSPDFSDGSRNSLSRTRQSSSSSGERPPTKKRPTSLPKNRPENEANTPVPSTRASSRQDSSSDFESNPDMFTAEMDDILSTPEVQAVYQSKTQDKKSKPKKKQQAYPTSNT